MHVHKDSISRREIGKMHLRVMVIKMLISNMKIVQFFHFRPVTNLRYIRKLCREMEY
jgi:hypothetical protein